MGVTQPLDGLERRPLHRTEYEALGRLGAFEDERVELLDGQVVYAAEEGPEHAGVCARLTRLLVEGIPAGEGEVRVGNPLAASDWSEPEPDFFVTTPSSAYRAAHPDHATLVIEVAQTSRPRDFGLKASVYASAGVPDYWVVDLARRAIVVHRDPQGSAFASVIAHSDGVLTPLHHPGATVDVRDLLS